MPRLSIITVAQPSSCADPGHAPLCESEMLAQRIRALNLTAKSLSLQQDAPAIEWIVIHAPDIPTEQAQARFPVSHAVALSASCADAANAGLELATGDYVLFLPAGDALADAHTLRRMEREALRHIRADVLYGMVRAGGYVRRLESPHLVVQRMITPLQSCLFRRAKIAPLRFDPGQGVASAYTFLLHVCAVTAHIEPVPEVWIDMAQEPAIIPVPAYYRVWRDVLMLSPPVRLMYGLRAWLVEMLRRFLPKLYRARRTAPKDRRAAPAARARTHSFKK